MEQSFDCIFIYFLFMYLLKKPNFTSTPFCNNNKIDTHCKNWPVMVTILKGYNQLQKVILNNNKQVKIVTFMLLVRLTNDHQLLWRI